MKGGKLSARALVQHGADIGMKSREGMNAAQYARKVGDLELAEYLESMHRQTTLSSPAAAVGTPTSLRRGIGAPLPSPLRLPMTAQQRGGGAEPNQPGSAGLNM